MPLRIPLPTQGGEALQRGVEHGASMFSNLLGQGNQRAQLAQQWQEHLRNAAIREQQEERLMAQHQFNMQSEPAKLDLLKAKLETEKQKAESLKKGGNQRITAAIQEADVLFDRNDPRHAMYILNKSKQFMPSEHQIKQDEELKSSPEFEKISPYLQNAVDMNPMPVASQNYYRKQMYDELVQIDKGKQVKHAISQAREIVKHNPDLYKKAINIIANPEASPGAIEKSLTAILPKKDVAAFAGLAKLYADILTKQAQLNGMSRSVYALRLQQQAKAQVKNPDEVNEQIFKNIEHEIAPSLDREKALLYAMKHNQYLPFTKNYNLDEGEPNQLPNEIHSPTEMGMMKGFIDGQEVDVIPEDKDDFIKAGGRF